MIELRPYQQWFRHSLLQAMKRVQRVLAVAPTGSGKRVQMVDLCLLATEHGRKVLVVTDRRLLVDQMAQECRAHGVHYGVIMADYCEGDPAGPVQIASLQTLQKRHFYEKWTGDLSGAGLPPANLLLVDEAHKEAARYRTLFSFYPDAKICGFTATPVGAEGRSLCPGFYDFLVEGALNTELIANGFLLPTTVLSPSEPSLRGVKLSRGEYSQGGLERAVQGCTTDSHVFREWEPYRDRASIAFVPGVGFGTYLVDQLNRRYGEATAALVTAKTKHNERQEIFKKIEQGELRVITSVDVLREGFDLPMLSVAIDLQPNNQLRSYWQKIGRIKRPFPGQDHATLLDFAGNFWRFPHPDEDPIWPVGEETTQEAIERSRTASKSPEPIACPKCHLVRQGGPVCPGCGYKCEERIRRIRMGDGKLVEVRADDLRKREISAEQRLFNKWKSRLFGALRSGLTYGQCAHLFKKDTGQSPKQGWVGVFGKDSLDWKRRPSTEHTMATLARACGNNIKELMK